MKRFPAYDSIFRQTLHNSLTRAVKYLIDNHAVKTLSTIAERTHISLSTLTGYMNGKKKISQKFQEDFKEKFGLDLNNPVSFASDPVLDSLSLSNLPDVSGVTYLIAHRTFQKRLRAQQTMIEGYKKTIEGLTAANEELYNYIIENDPVLVKKAFRMHKGG